MGNDPKCERSSRHEDFPRCKEKFVKAFVTSLSERGIVSFDDEKTEWKVKGQNPNSCANFMSFSTGPRQRLHGIIEYQHLI